MALALRITLMIRFGGLSANDDEKQSHTDCSILVLIDGPHPTVRVPLVSAQPPDYFFKLEELSTEIFSPLRRMNNSPTEQEGDTIELLEKRH